MKNNQDLLTSAVININGLPNLYDFMYRTYSAVKEGKKKEDSLSDQEKLEIDILFLLEQLGYPMDKTGTYFYKDIINSAIKKINNFKRVEELIELKREIDNNYSQFYFDIARNTHDLGLTTFHACLENVQPQKTENKKNNNLRKKIGIHNPKMTSNQKALQIAKYIVYERLSNKHFLIKSDYNINHEKQQEQNREEIKITKQIKNKKIAIN